MVVAYLYILCVLFTIFTGLGEAEVNAVDNRLVGSLFSTHHGELFISEIIGSVLDHRGPHTKKVKMPCLFLSLTTHLSNIVELS